MALLFLMRRPKLDRVIMLETKMLTKKYRSLLELEEAPLEAPFNLERMTRKDLSVKIKKAIAYAACYFDIS